MSITNLKHLYFEKSKIFQKTRQDFDFHSFNIHKYKLTLRERDIR